MRILIVDDNPAVRDGISRLLKSNGHEVADASHGDNVIYVLTKDPKNSFDLVITDYEMPGHKNGHEVIQMIKGEFPNLEVWLCSGAIDETSSGQKIAEDAIRYGASLAFPKTECGRHIQCL